MGRTSGSGVADVGIGWRSALASGRRRSVLASAFGDGVGVGCWRRLLASVLASASALALALALATASASARPQPVYDRACPCERIARRGATRREVD